MQEQDTTDASLGQMHLDAEKTIKAFSYTKPDAVSKGKGFVRLATSPLLKGVVQIVKKNGGENNLHYHTNVDTFWMVLKGRARFYGPEDKLIGEFGPSEGTVTPRYSRYWFENAGEDDLELLQVAAFVPGVKDGGRTDVSAQKFIIAEGEQFDAAKAVASA